MITQSKNAPKLNSSLDWYYSNASSSNYNCYVLDYIFTVDITQFIFAVIKIMSITKFDDSETADR